MLKSPLLGLSYSGYITEGSFGPGLLLPAFHLQVLQAVLVDGYPYGPGPILGLQVLLPQAGGSSMCPSASTILPDKRASIPSLLNQWR